YYKNSCPASSPLQDFMLICPGSVGQPRSGTPGAEYAILYPDPGRLEFRRIAYDMDKTIADMKRLQLPDELIQRLRHGQ
ncbi:MAG TPA: phosphoesterase, partial [Mariprofundaceae bacterium]|nr:phosphoesterase [Mariprofundaceae bacterium]